MDSKVFEISGHFYLKTGSDVDEILDLLIDFAESKNGYFSGGVILLDYSYLDSWKSTVEKLPMFCECV